MSLRRRLSLLLAALVVTLGVGARQVVLDVEAHDRSAQGAAVRTAETRLLVAQVLTDFLDQDTSVQAFVITGDDRLLEPYATGQVRADADESRLRATTRVMPGVQEPLAAVVEAGRSWQAIATAAIAARRTSTDAAAIVSGDGRARFDRVRNAVGALQDAVATRATAARRGIAAAHQRATVLALAFLAGTLVLLTGAGVLVWTWVARPVRRIRTDIAATMAGDADRTIGRSGPPEVAALAGDIEALRAALSDGRAQAEADARLDSDLVVKLHADLRTPVSGLLGLLSLLARTDLDAEQRDYTHTARGSATALLSIIDGTLGAVGVPTAPYSDRDVLDAGVVQQLRDLGEHGGVDLVAQLADVIARDVPPRLRAIRDAIATGDSEQLAREAHSLKGSTGNVGALEMAGWCAEMERIGRAGETAPAATLASRVENQLDAVLAALRSPRP